MRIEIWSDIVCPWCAIGKAHLDAALAQFEHADEVEVVWRSFELDPGAPRVKDGPYAERLARKYGTSVDAARAMVDRMTATAAAAGVEFHLENARPGNTFDAHRVVHLAIDRGLQTEVKERFLRAYLAEGEPIGDPDTVERLAVEAGLDRAEVRHVLDSEAYAAEVRADEEEALEHGWSAVPLFLIDRMFAIPGAQPPDVILRTLQRAWEKTHLVTVVGDGEVCGPDGCPV